MIAFTHWDDVGRKYFKNEKKKLLTKHKVAESKYRKFVMGGDNGQTL